MAEVLIINGSITPKEKSYSWAVAKKFIEKYKALHPQDEIIDLDLNFIPMAQKNLNETNFHSFFNNEDSDKYIQQLKHADKLVIISPMYNFGVSTILKNYLDHVLVADKTFSYKYAKANGSVGLLKNLKVQIIGSQGAPKGWYSFGNHIAYLEGVADFIGAKINHPSILLAGTKTQPLNNLSPQAATKVVEAEINQAVKNF